MLSNVLHTFDKKLTEELTKKVLFIFSSNLFQDKKWMLVDSLIIRPYYVQFPIFDPQETRNAVNYRMQFENEQAMVLQI